MNPKNSKNILTIDKQKVAQELKQHLQRTMERLNREGIVFGFSGGLDSAVIAYMAQNVCPPEKILALIMPEKETSRENMQDAVNLAKELHIRYQIIYLDSYLESAGVRFPVPFLNYRLKSKLIRIFYKRMKQRTGETPYITLLQGGNGYSFKKY